MKLARTLTALGLGLLALGAWRLYAGNLPQGIMLLQFGVLIAAGGLALRRG
jgi:hypothetical protein